MTMTLAASRAARSDTAVVFACDGAYDRYALFAADQIARLHPGRSFDICLCGIGNPPSVPDSLAALDVRVCTIGTGGAFEGLRLDPGRSEIVYLRLALPRVFSRDYRRLLYLDADIFVQGGDLGALIEADLGPHTLAAVRDNQQWRAPRRRTVQFRRLGLPAAPYCNAGVMLIDTARFEAADVLGRCTAFGRAHRNRMIRHDQNLLNAVLAGDWAELHPTWNWQYTRATMLFETLHDASIVHFIGPRKPWSPRPGLHPSRFRRAYRQFLEAHYPGAALSDLTAPLPVRDRAVARQLLWRHQVALGRFADYLGRFDGELDVRDSRA